MPATVKLLDLAKHPRAADELADILIDCVEGGASVSFMLPLDRPRAVAFWEKVLASYARGETLLLVAEDEEGSLIRTVQVILSQPENQPHRGDVAKMLVHRRGRRKGLGLALLQAAETHAKVAGKTLLVLDTVTGADGDRLYQRGGWTRVGEIPGYALFPSVEPCPTTYYYKVL